MTAIHLQAAALAVVILALPAPAQVDVGWFRSATNQHADYVQRLAIGPGGTIATVGAGTATPSTPSPLTVYSATGDVLWNRTWTVAGDRVAIQDIVFDLENGDLYAVGTSQEYANEQDAVAGSANIVVGRFDAGGTLVWERTWDGPNFFDDVGARLALDGLGHVVVSGISTTSGTQTYRTRVVELSYGLDGAPQWQKVVDATAATSAEVNGLATAANGDVLVAGTGAGSYPDQQITLTRIDPQGVELWTRTYSGPVAGFDRAWALAIDSTSKAYVSGLVTNAQGVSEGALVAWDASGALLWSRVGAQLHPNRTSFFDMQVDARGDLVLCGTVWNGTPTGQDAIVAKFDSAGQPLWQRTWSGEGDRIDRFSSLEIDGQRGIITAGSTAHQVFGPVFERDPLVVRYDADGATRWEHRGLFSFANSDYVNHVGFGPVGAVVYAGATTSTVGGQLDALLVGLVEQSVPFCFGDGSGTACPCANESAVGDGAGCRNSLGVGARLTDSGNASDLTDTLELHVTGVPNSPVLYYQGSQRVLLGAGSVFGDGLSCAGGTVHRLGTVTAVGGASAYPPPGGIPVSVRGFVQLGQTYHYQARYRNVAPFCTSATFNQTNGLSIAWGI